MRITSTSSTRTMRFRDSGQCCRSSPRSSAATGRSRDPLIGAVVIYLADQLVFKEFMPIGHQIVLGALLAAMILFAPEGLLSVFAKRLPWPGRMRVAAASRDA